MFSDIAITQALGFASLVFTGILSYFMFRAKSASELAVIQANAASAAAIAAANKVDTVAAAQIVVAEKVETVAVTAGVAANRALEAQRDMKSGVESRIQMLGGLVAEVAEVKKIAADTLILSDGMMGNTLEIGREAAQGRYDAAPTPENKAKLDAARKRVEEHAAKERIVEAKNAGAK